MNIRLLAFASVSDLLGERELIVPISAGCSVGELKRQLETSTPGLAVLWAGIAVGINGQLCNDDSILADGDEVALLPPVSGGAGEPARLVDGPIDVAEVRREIEDARCGAVVIFIGNVRDHHQHRGVERITYTAYRSMALAGLKLIQGELEEGFESCRVAIFHRLGELDVGEASVVIAVSAPHRSDAYTASRLALERLKAEIPIWKKEHYSDGQERWREEEALTAPTTARS